MSNSSNIKTRDRRSTRSVYSRNVEQNSNDETDESKHSENSNSKNEISSPMKIVNQQDSKKEVLYKSFEAKEDIAQIENIPDNTQVLSPKVTEDVKDVELDIKKEKRGYRKKATKDGLTDREWLASRDNRDKWSALDAKRGMCNDCKKLFSSRQALRYHCEASRDCFRMGKFCREDHDHQYVSKEFESLDDIMNWLHSEELDTQFSCKGGYSSFEAAEKHRRMPNKIYWCNRNPRTKSYVPKRGEKSSSRKLPAGQRCPAIIQIRAQKVVIPNQDENNYTSKSKMVTPLENGENEGAEAKSNSLLATKIIWRVKGCLTHSHEADDTGKSLRLSKRVRRNIGLLLKLDLPMPVIRSKYLKVENFGGSSGKIPSIESARQIQLSAYPAPPDLSCPEMEIVFRYMRYSVSVRAFNFKRAGVDTSTNPTSGVRDPKSKSSKDDLTGALMERDTLARAVTADDVIVIFMDEHQRKLFRESSGAIIISSLDQIFTNTSYSIYSVCVLDCQGEAFPVCQAVSANDSVSTAKIMLDTMKLLEPSIVSKIHCLMASESLENAFIQALSETLPPNSELSTYPSLHHTFVETYEYILQSSLKPIVTRLDQLIYSVFKMNEFLQCKRERYLCGFYGKIRTKKQKTFESLHEMYDEQPKDDIRFEILEATTQDVRLDDNSVKSAENQAWEISKFEGNTLVDNESFLVSRIPNGNMICPRTNKCQLFCEKCIKDSGLDFQTFNHELVAGSLPCGHTLTCSCSEFNSNYNCIHIHIVGTRILSNMASSDKAKLEIVGSKYVSRKPNHEYVRENNYGTVDSPDKGRVSTEEKHVQDVLEKNIRPCAVKLQKLEDIDLNKALNTPFDKMSKDNSCTQFNENILIDQAIAKMDSALRYLRKMKQKQNVSETYTGEEDHKGQRKSGRKRRRPFVKNMCMDVIDFIESNFPEHIQDIRKQIGYSSGVFQSEASNISIKGEENEPIKLPTLVSPIKEKPAYSCKTENTSLIENPATSHPQQLIGVDMPRRNLLRVALNADVSDISWCTLLSGNFQKNLEMFLNLEEFDINQREIILKKFVQAKSLWECSKCKDFSSLESMLSGFIICKICQHWFHRKCCTLATGEIPTSTTNTKDDLICERCVSLFFANISDEALNGEGVVSSQQDIQLQSISADAPIAVNDLTEKNYIVENLSDPQKLTVQGEQIEFIQAQPVPQAQELTEDQISAGSQIYYQLPPNVTFPTTGEGHYVVQLQGNTVQQIGFEVI